MKLLDFGNDCMIEFGTQSVYSTLGETSQYDYMAIKVGNIHTGRFYFVAGHIFIIRKIKDTELFSNLFTTQDNVFVHKNKEDVINLIMSIEGIPEEAVKFATEIIEMKYLQMFGALNQVNLLNESLKVGSTTNADLNSLKDSISALTDELGKIIGHTNREVK